MSKREMQERINGTVNLCNSKVIVHCAKWCYLINSVNRITAKKKNGIILRFLFRPSFSETPGGGGEIVENPKRYTYKPYSIYSTSLSFSAKFWLMVRQRNN